MGKVGNQRKVSHKILARPDQPALSQIGEFKIAGKDHKEWAQELLDLFAGIRFLDLVPELMRKPAFPGQSVLGDSGENLPTALQSICVDPARKSVLMEWVRELTPMDVVDFEFPLDPVTGLVQLAFKENNGNPVSVYSASDGTLRFLAMLASLLGPKPARLYFFEEIDNGIHPSRLRLLLDLIERQTEKGNFQVVTTTHSPDLVSMVSDSTFESTSVVFRSPEADSAIIARVADLPNAPALRQSQGLGRLHASGWTWILAGLDLPKEWVWVDVRRDVSVKERYFEPLAHQRGVDNGPGGGHKALGEEAARRLTEMRQKCPEDLDHVAIRLEAAVAVA